MTTIVFNGKFRSQSATGVQRVAEELLTALGALKLRAPETLEGIDLVLAVPKSARMTPLPGFQITAPGRLGGVAWEQLELPWVAGNRPLVNLCNVGPLSRRGDVLMLHDAQAFDTPQSYSPAFVRYYWTLTPRLAARAGRVLTVSDFARERLSLAGVAPFDAMSVVLNGVDHILRLPLDPSIRGQLGLDSRPYIVGPGSVQAHKNVQVLIKAARAFADPDLRLVLYGPSGREDFEALGLVPGDNVIFAGRVSDGAMRTLIEGATAFAFPSLTEGFGLPPLEAMLLKTPAIVSRAGPMPELCGDAALCVDPLDEAAWADAINRIASDAAVRAAYARSGHERAKLYRWSDAAESLAGVLRGLV